MRLTQPAHRQPQPDDFWKPLFPRPGHQGLQPARLVDTDYPVRASRCAGPAQVGNGNHFARAIPESSVVPAMVMGSFWMIERQQGQTRLISSLDATRAKDRPAGNGTPRGETKRLVLLYAVLAPGSNVVTVRRCAAETGERQNNAIGVRRCGRKFL